MTSIREKIKNYTLDDNYAISAEDNSLSIDEYVRSITANSLMVDGISSSAATSTITSSTSVTSTPNTGSSINLNGNLIYNQSSWTAPVYTYSGYNYKIPSSVYTEEKITKDILDNYANDSFIFDKTTKIMLYKDANGDIFIQNAFRKVSIDDIERELELTEKESLLQKEIDDYFRD